MPRFLFLLALLLLPLQAMEIVHGDTAIPPQEVRTERPLIIASEQAAALGWMQMYVFHPTPAERAELLRAGQAAGAMAILPAGSRLKLLAMARNRGAFMAEIVSVGTGESRTPALGAATHRQVPAADASYPFSIPPAPSATERLKLQAGATICCDSADARAASADTDSVWEALISKP